MKVGPVARDDTHLMILKTGDHAALRVLVAPAGLSADRARRRCRPPLLPATRTAPLRPRHRRRATRRRAREPLVRRPRGLARTTPGGAVLRHRHLTMAYLMLYGTGWTQRWRIAEGMEQQIGAEISRVGTDETTQLSVLDPGSGAPPPWSWPGHRSPPPSSSTRSGHLTKKRPASTPDQRPAPVPSPSPLNPHTNAAT